MANLKPHKFTMEERSKGGRTSASVKLKTKLINQHLTAYIEGVKPFNKGNALIDDLLTLTAKERMTFLINYMPYEKPKMATIEQVVEVSQMDISRDEREARIIQLLKVNK